MLSDVGVQPMDLVPDELAEASLRKSRHWSLCSSRSSKTLAAQHCTPRESINRTTSGIIREMKKIRCLGQWACGIFAFPLVSCSLGSGVCPHPLPSQPTPWNLSVSLLQPSKTDLSDSWETVSPKKTKSSPKALLNGAKIN